jgi:succinate dehydrogenase / fumarate reductase cytochrome b subunit
MSALASWWHSSVGKKQVMGVTGLLLLGWVTLHMIGNLQAFQGAESLNRYAHLLQGAKGPLWIMRGGLLVALVLHVVAAAQLTRRSLAARPVGYAVRDPQVSTVAARTLRIGGVLILGFIVIHLMTFTTGQLHPDFVREDVYHNLQVVFRSPYKVAFYALVMLALGLHVFHGAWSSFRSLGTTRPGPEPLRRRAALVWALAVALGFVAVPLAIYAGFIR